jgi:ABC-type transport system involved in multi-copper enzyme maturation permease subunit
MYFWKCWRDTRSFFIVFLIIAAAVMPVAAVVCVGTGLVENFGAEAFRSTFGLIALSAALALGALCASEEFAEKTTQFLFTKPRSRAYFVWAAWSVGCAQWMAIVLVNLLAGWVTLSRYNRNPFHLAVFGPITKQQIGDVLIHGLYIYCLTYSLTTVLRSGLKGLGASMAIVFGIPFFAIAIRWRWKIYMPIPPLRIGSLPMVISNIIWILVALLFVFAAQRVVERSEV